MRLQLEALEAREVPAVTNFSFALDDGSFGEGSFDYADAQVDSTQANQQLAATDVQIMLNGQSVAVEGVLIAPTVAFSQGEFRGISFAYDVASANYDFLTVGGSSAAAITSAGGLAQGAVSVVGVPGLAPLPAPPASVIDPDPMAVLTAHNNNVAGLIALADRLQDKIVEVHQLATIVSDLANLEMTATSPFLQAIAGQLADHYYAKLAVSSGSLLADHDLYSTQYLAVMADATFLFGSDGQGGFLPAMYAPLATPIPELLSIPPEYFQPFYDGID